MVLQDADWTKKGPHQQHHLLEKLSIKGHEILVICFDQLWKQENGGLISERRSLSGVSRFYSGSSIKYIRPTFIRLPILDYLSFLVSSRSEIKKYIKEFDPDIVIGFTSIISNYWGAKFANQKGIPFIYYWTDVIHTLIPFKPFQKIAELAEIYIIKNSASVITINEALKDVVVSYGSDPYTTKVITGGVDFKRFDSSIDSSLVRKMLNLSENDLVMFFMGWIYPFSGLKEVVLDVIEHKDSHPHLKLLIVGEGESYEELKSLANIYNLKDNLIFTGWIPYDKIPQYLAASDICLLPAYNNDVMRSIVPIKMYEYLAMHKPIVSTRLNGIFMEFKENSGVIYIDAPMDVVQTVLALSREDIELLRDNASRFIQGYSWDSILSQFEQHLQTYIYGQ